MVLIVNVDASIPTIACASLIPASEVDLHRLYWIKGVISPLSVTSKSDTQQAAGVDFQESANRGSAEQ